MSECLECGLRVTNHKQRCQECKELDYLLIDFVDGERLKRCQECRSGFGPRGVTDLLAMQCLFCSGTLQTWYVFKQKGKMRCTECKAVRPSHPPLVPEQCPSCYNLEPLGLQTFNGVSRCDACFRELL